ncbi:hypothetical protein TRICI_003413 [Trichomonascus ciferrii]|uniref:DUF1682-domain-containing protein n=1 Tax=Trichomonascus ciferrii TaxID=44093 RepID=A0A642V447_9ASCO|nr:hypothetical protein TRICI_003413 [Trichomonascus ciferrii]
MFGLVFATATCLFARCVSANILQASSTTPPEWQNMTILQRLMDYDWTKEAIIGGTLLAYVALHFYGVNRNKSKVTKWINDHNEVLANQFYQVGTKHPQGDLIVSDSPTQFTTYASGRENIRNLTAAITLKNRQNIVTMFMEEVMGMFWKIFQTKDSIEIVIRPSIGLDPFIFAVVNKEVMQAAREDNYYLSLTRTTDSEKLPIYYTFMTESAEISDAMFNSELSEAIHHPNSQNVLEYVAITDQLTDRPTTLEAAAARPQIRLSMKFPSSKEDLEASKKVLNSAINMIDFAAKKGRWRPEVTRKIKNTREAEVKKVQKLLDEEKAEELAQKKAEKKREQQQNLSKLSPAEQRKAEQKEREKEQRKQAKRQSKRQQIRS